MTVTTDHDSDTHFRNFTPDLEVRSSGDGRTVTGIAVPFNRPQRIDTRLTEQFRSGAFDQQLRAGARVPFGREHLGLGGVLIGTTVVLRNDSAGLYGEWRVSRTPAGDETLELIKDGALSQLSIGFRERQNATLPGGVTERVKAHLTEVAVVLNGAYESAAAVAAVRAMRDDRANALRQSEPPRGPDPVLADILDAHPPLDELLRADRGNIDTPDAAKLNTAARKYCASRGWAMKDGSYPIRPANMHGASDLDKAVQAVGRGKKPAEQIHAHIMKRARAIGEAERIPENW